MPTITIHAGSETFTVDARDRRPELRLDDGRVFKAVAQRPDGSWDYAFARQERMT
ncbi:MAG TPA: hypothetical protein VMY35_04760 [Phycisphaerae bacterium]|nr:hypothetical protein [Phycisphaerae bacterium]